MKNKIITGIVLILAVAGIMYKLNKNKEEKETATAIVAEKNATVSVRSALVKEEMVQADFIANGTFAPAQELNLSSETPGQVSKVLVKEGDRVSVGQTLAVIKGDKLNVNVNTAQASYNNALADAARFESAFKTGGVTQQQLDQVKLQLATAKNNLQNARITAGDAIIKATIPGIINTKSVEPGSYVNPGTPLFEIVNVNKLKLKVAVDEKNVGLTKVGNAIKVTSSVYPDKTFSGKITFVAPKADATLNFPVEIEITNNASNDLKAGMYGTAVFENNTRTPILVAPRAAFVGSVSSNQVYVVKNNVAVLTKVTTGRNFGDTVEILSGVNSGEEVITSGQINLLDQTPVTIIK